MVTADAEGARPPLTVGAALGLPSLRRGAPEVCAGKDELARPIRWAHSSEVPDIATHLRGGELLLVTGMGIKRSAQGQRSFVTGLAERGIAGLVLELGEVFQRVPQPMARAAADLELPFVVLHRAVPFVEVTEEIHAEIVAHQLAGLRRADALQELLTGMLLKGAGVLELITAVADALGNPTVLADDQGDPLLHAPHRHATPQVLRRWQELRAGAGDPPDGDPPSLVIPLPGGTGDALAVLGLDGPLGDARALLERAAGVVALALARSGRGGELTGRECGSFLADLGSGRLDADDAAARARDLGFEHPRGVLLPIALVVEATGRHGDDGGRWGPVWRAVRDGAVRRGLPVLVGPHGTGPDALALVGLARREDRGWAADSIAASARDAVGRQPACDGGRLTIAVGAAVARWDHVPEALREAIDTARVRDLPDRPWHDAVAADVLRLLWELRDDERMVTFVERRLGPVLRHDARRAAKLLPTLEALSDHQWNKSDSARALHLNRQALYPRLRRIERLLDVDLDEPSVRLGLDLAVRAHAAMRARPGAGRPQD